MRLFDMHCDTIYECATKGELLLNNQIQLDLMRGLQYDAWAQAFAVWMPDGLRGDDAWRQCRNMLKLAHREAETNSNCMSIVMSSRDLDEALKNGRCAAILTVEGASALAGKIDTLDEMAELGVKIITLTWNGSNELGHGCVSGCKDGLTAFGKSAVRAMELRHILPDVSHLNEAGFWDVMDCTQGPVIASHSVAAGVYAHPRNLTDAQFAAICKRGGLVGLTLCAAQLGDQTFECIERHLEHYLSIDGRYTVGFGCDFDGTDLPPEWGGIEIMEKIYEYLQRKNYEDSILDRLFFSNCYDFFHSALTMDGDMV